MDRSRAAAGAAPFPASRPGDEPYPDDASTGLESIGSATFHCLALIALAMLLILVLLPALLGAAGIQAVAAT